VLSQLLRGQPPINVLVDRRSAERRRLDTAVVERERREQSDRRQSGCALVLG
jgi:hypothetical protein